jgi:hypothetical protein
MLPSTAAPVVFVKVRENACCVLCVVVFCGALTIHQAECDKVAYDKRFPASFQLALTFDNIEAGSGPVVVDDVAADRQEEGLFLCSLCSHFSISPQILCLQFVSAVCWSRL